MKSKNSTNFFLSINILLLILFSQSIFSQSINQLEQSSPINKDLQRQAVFISDESEYNLNPQTANYSSEAQILTALYEGLFTYDPYTLDPIPAIAQSFSISRNKRRWTFNLRNDAAFSNGSAITSQTIKESWLNVLNPKTNAPFASLLDCIEGAAAYRTGLGEASDVGILTPDEYTLIVRLNTPTEHFAKILCHHSFVAYLPNEFSAFSGPFVIEKRTPNEILLKKNNLYYDAESVALPSILIQLSEDTTENTYIFNTGKADWISSNFIIDKILNPRAVKISAQFGTEYLFFKSHRAPWNNSILRNALLLAIPWDKLRANTFVQADTFIMPLNGYPEVIGIGDQSIEDAIDLLKQAGFDKNGKSISGDQENLKIVIAISDADYMVDQAKILAEAWEKIGVEVIIQKTPNNRYIDSIDNWNADIFSYTWIGDFADPVAFLELFRGDSSLSESYWDSTKYDEILSLATNQTNQQKRYELLAEAEQILLDSGVILPISHPVSVNVIDTKVLGGWYENPLDIHPFKYLYFMETGIPPNMVMAF